MDWILPTGIAAASLALTYVFCLRPMRNGHCGMMPAGAGRRDTDVQRLRAEIAELRAAQGGPPGDGATAGADSAVSAASGAKANAGAPPASGCC